MGWLRKLPGGSPTTWSENPAAANRRKSEPSASRRAVPAGSSPCFHRQESTIPLSRVVCRQIHLEPVGVAHLRCLHHFIQNLIGRKVLFQVIHALAGNREIGGFVLADQLRFFQAP